MSTRYPLCEAAGLIGKQLYPHLPAVIPAEDVERALERLKSVYIEPEPKEQDVELGSLEFTGEDFTRIWAFATPSRMVVEMNRILAEKIAALPVVYGREMGEGMMYIEKGPLSDQTHTARLIAIEPIARESAEDVLRDWIQSLDGVDRDIDRQTLIRRARKVLERGE